MNRPQVNVSWLVALELKSNQLEGDSGWVGWLELKFDQLKDVNQGSSGGRDYVCGIFPK